MNIKILAFGLLAVPALAIGASRAAGDATEYDQHDVTIPTRDDDGESVDMVGKVCVPSDAEGKPRLVIVNHGSPASAADRPSMELGSCDSEVAQWFLSRGYAVLYALRRGYGDTGGDWAENFGPCDHPDYRRAGLESARDVGAMVEFASRLSYVRPNGMIVAGVSAGGWATDAYDSLPHPKVVAMISMAGGRGGHQGGKPNSNCHPEALAAAAGAFGHGAATPMLWVYAQNDTFFGPQIASALYAAFTKAGGRADFHRLGPQGSEGHYLWSMRGGSTVWGPLVEAYLKQRGAWDQTADNDDDAQ